MWKDMRDLKKKAVIFTVFCTVLPLHAAQFAGGTGEPNDPYQIATAEQLVSIGSDPNLLDKCFILTADIDLDPNLPGGKVFDTAVVAPTRETSGSSDVFMGIAFSGVFDGNDHTISNLTIQGQGYLGLFGAVSGVVRNLSVVNADVSSSGNDVGLLAGACEGTVTRCHSDGTVVGGDYIGGLIGRIVEGRVIRCNSEVVIAATGDWVGGLVGVSYNGVSIVASYSSGSVSGRNWIGGLVGRSDRDGSIVMSYSTAFVVGSWRVGGLVGSNDGGTVSLSYSTGSVLGFRYVGGLLGMNDGCLTHCYSVGSVTGEVGAGGLVGRGYHGLSIACFWDVESSGQTVSGTGEGKTTAEMWDVFTFLAAGWDFVDEAANGTSDSWQIGAGEYPQLRCYASDRSVMPEGLGTDAEPYLIRDANDLGVLWFEPDASYCLISSIDLSGIFWSVAVVPWFNGTLDGNGYVIRNLQMQGGGCLGLIGQAGPGARILNLGLETTDVNGIGGYVGGLVGSSEGDIDGSHVTGVIAGGECAGGLVGNNEGSISDSYGAGTIHGRSAVGGLAGYNSGSITSCHSAGDVKANSMVGGLVGDNKGGRIVASWSTADVSGAEDIAGGLVGQHMGWITASLDGSGFGKSRVGEITGSHSTGTVSGQSTVGGLVGRNCANVVASYSCNTVGGYKYVGGLVGYNDGDIATCSSASAVGADNYVGGLVGYNFDSIADSYCTGAVSGNDNVGGLVGYNSDRSTSFSVNGRIAMCYSAATVQGAGSVGGLVGSGRAGDCVTASFWDIETSGQATSFAGTGRTTTEMQMIATFVDAGWDFVDIWTICEGKDYPRLQWEGIDCNE